MCQIFYLPPGTRLNPELAERERASNPDGWGAMQATGLQVSSVYGKGARGLQAIVQRLNDAADTPRALHLRWASKGSKGYHNQHPVMIRGVQIGLMHNGTVEREKFTDDANRKSDTVMVSHWLESLMPEVESNTRFLKVAAEVLPLVCWKSRWLLMSRTGEVLRLGQWQWSERYGIWTSQHLAEDWETKKIAVDHWDVGVGGGEK